MDSSGAIGIAASGTNQNITLTPSGSTGRVLIGNTPSFQSSTLSVKPATGARGFSVEAQSSDAVIRLWHDGTTANIASDYQATAGYKPLAFHLSNVEKARFAISGNLLLGGLTTDGTGVLQFPAATTSAGGITFGTDINAYRGASNEFNITANNSVSLGLLLRNNGTGIVALQVDATNAYLDSQRTGGGLVLRTNGTTAALTLDSSQNATFAGTIIGGSSQALSGAGAVDVTHLITNFTSTGGAQALTLANGTDGQIKVICHVVDGGSGVLTPTTKTGFTTITFTNAGDSVTLKYTTTTGWFIIGIFGAVAA